jgi:hypothetical protein
MRRHGFGLLGATILAISSPTLACETAPSISQLPGETQKETYERFEKTHSEQWVIRRYQRESSSFKMAKSVYLAKVIASSRDQGTSVKPISKVQPIEAIKGTMPIGQRTLAEISNESCSDWGDGYGDGQGSAAKVGTLVIVFEGLPKSEYRPNGIDSLMAESVRTFELLEPLYKHGKEVPEDVLWGRVSPKE